MKRKLILIIGVSGCGKSSLAQSLSKQLDCIFIEADDFHSEEAKRKMSQGIALTDEDRAPWIYRLCQKVKYASKDVVLCYSGLRYQHRQAFRALGLDTLFFHLTGDRALLEQRLNARAGHFMSADLLQSQFDAFEAIKSDEHNVIKLNFKHDITSLTLQCLSCLASDSEHSHDADE